MQARQRLLVRAHPRKSVPSRPRRLAPSGRDLRTCLQQKETTIDLDPMCPACACEEPDASYRCFTTVRSGVDETNGRYADVRVDRCLHCQRLWLRYAVEYEGFSRSGRWARGLISEAEVEALAPEGAPAHLERLPNYLYGGSYFDGRAGSRTGPMHWDG